MHEAFLDTPPNASSSAGGGKDAAAPHVVILRGKPRFATQIVFGDSLSDVGSYAVGTVKALGGGKFTINGDHSAVDPALSGQNWVEQLAKMLGLQAPCAAQTGLDGDAAQGFSVPVTDHIGCFAYAQGGSRVTHPVGPTHKLTGHPLGGLTVPVARQIARHLQVSGGRFKADDIVLVMAGGNDLFYELKLFEISAPTQGRVAAQKAFNASLVAALACNAFDPAVAALAIREAMARARAVPGSTEECVVRATIAAAAGLPGNAGVANPTVHVAMVAKAKSDAELASNQYLRDSMQSLVAAMSAAGAELAALVKEQILANGAEYVVVNNLPDAALTPSGRAMGPKLQALIAHMSQTFNAQLRNALAQDVRVLLVDAYSLTQAAAANPAAYGLTNMTDTACDLFSEKNPLRSSLGSSAASLKAGDVSRYAYADGEHPTPFFYGVLAQHVSERMKQNNWL